MNYLLIAVETLSYTLMFASLLLLIRNRRVYKFRSKLLAQVSEAVDDDLKKGRYTNWEWRFDVLGEVEYTTMVYKFWKPLKAESFYSNTLFLQKDAIVVSVPKGGVPSNYHEQFRKEN